LLADVLGKQRHKKEQATNNPSPEVCQGGFDERHPVLGHAPLQDVTIKDPRSKVVAFFRDPREACSQYRVF
jgi:hypothetical protein